MTQQAVFDALKALLLPFDEKMERVTDEPQHYYLNTRHIMKNNKPLFFAAIKVNKRYVSFHLMPVYVFPELLNDTSPQLKARMQGKSCFNFKQVDPHLFSELGHLVEAGANAYKKAGYLNN